MSGRKGRRRVGRILAALAVLVFGCLAILIVGFRGRTPLLLSVATQVVPKGRFGATAFAWRSNDEYLAFGPDRRTLSRYRISGGTRTPMQAPLDVGSQGRDLQVSPDGKWLFWICELQHGSNTIVLPRLTSIEDARTHSITIPDNSRWAWDSRSLIGTELSYQEEADENVVTFDIVDDRTESALPISSKFGFYADEVFEAAPGRLLMTGVDEESGSIGVAEYQGDRNPQIVKKWLAPPGGQMDREETKLSPSGDRIAWLALTAHAEPGRAALHRLLPFLSAPPHLYQELWVARLDGTGKRLVGQIPLRDGVDAAAKDLLWLPDGKRLSFQEAGALWTVPAP